MFGRPTYAREPLSLPDRLHNALSDHYLVERELGRGGMATVYLARDVKHDRYVAIKVLHPELAAALGSERFLSEIKTTAKLQHPHILQLLDSGDADGLLYYVMPYVEGETLRGRLERERQLPITDALRIAREVADALGAAHAHGIIHRDIKPENILLQGDHALVADFGIALAVQQAGGSRMTQTGLSLGTPQYMSPEQAMGEKVIDARSDIYALGAVTYEMLVGEPPFTGPSVQAIVARLMSEDPRSIVAQRKAVDESVEYAVMRALEKLPADRFASAHEFATALSEAAPEGSAARTSSSRAAYGARGAKAANLRRRKAAVPLGAALLLGAILAGTGAWTAASRRNENQSISFTVEPPVSDGFRQTTTDVGVSPDGAILSFAAQSDSSWMLYLRSLADVDAHAMPGTTGFWVYAIAPDGKRVAFIAADSKLRIAPIEGGAAVTVAQLARPWSGLEWADDKTLVVGGLPSGEGLWLFPTTGGAPRQLFKAKAPSIQGKPFVGDDGETVFFLDWGPGFTEDDYLAIGSLKTGEFQTSKLLANGIVGVVDGRVLYTTVGGALMAVRYDRRSHRLSGNPEHLIDGLTKADHRTASLSRSGTLIYERGQPTQRLVVADSAGMQPISTDDRALVALGQFTGTVRYSPDGRHIAVNVIDERSDVTISDIWTFDVAARTFTPVTTRGDVIAPEWTPDGRRLVFMKWFEKKPTIFWQAADGSDSATSLVQLPEGQSVYTVSVTPDGRGIVYCTGSTAVEGHTFAYYLPFGDRVPEKLFDTEGDLSSCNARVSRDGRWLAYVLGSGAQTQVHVRPFRSAGGRVQVSIDGGDSPVWSPDGQRLYYRSAGGSVTRASFRSDAASLTVTKRERIPGVRGVTLYDVAPDGNRIVMTQSSDSHKQIVVTTNWVSLLRARPR